MRAAPIAGFFCLVACSSAQPAFLDKSNEIRCFVPGSHTIDEMRKAFEVRIGSKKVQVVDVLAGDPATEFSRDYVTLPGTFQKALGGNDWDPSSANIEMAHLDGDRFELVVHLPAGKYEYKIARGGNWTENYGAGFVAGGANLVIDVPTDQIVRFVVDFSKKIVLNSIDHPDSVSKPTTEPAKGSKPVVGFQSFRVVLERPVSAGEISADMGIQVLGGTERPVFVRNVLSEPIYTYKGDDLGSTWTPSQTTFRVWSPSSTSAQVALFDAAKSDIARTYDMKRSENGTWMTTVKGNLAGKFYQYVFVNRGETRTAADIYCRAATADSSKSMIVDISKTNPKGWPGKAVFTNKSQTDAILYELSVRDFTIQPESGVREDWAGKFLGLTQTGTTHLGMPTGLDYLKWLGVTHVHLLPIQDFNPEHLKGYNWGYETTLFNLPEAQYASNPDDPLSPIVDCKQMVQSMHQAGLGVVLDVVYNHSVPAQGEHSAFWQTERYAYFRTNDRGEVLNESGVGNALNDDMPMVRKFIGDSLVYWTKEYKVDGFRFDLVGMFEPESVKEWAGRVRAVNPSAVIYGEPWTGGGPTRLGKGDQKGTGTAVFNDNFRNTIRGELDGPGAGFASGGGADRGALVSAMMGSIVDFTDGPDETINYVSAHDNMTLLDKFSLIKGVDPTKCARLANACVLLSQGVPFLEGGAELGRTKGDSHNSYNLGDEVNQYDWKRATQFVGLSENLKQLIEIRKQHPAFRLKDKKSIQQYVRAWTSDRTPPRSLIYEIDGAAAGDSWAKIIVVWNGQTKPLGFEQPSGYQCVFGDYEIEGSLVKIDALSAAIFVAKK